MLIDYHIHSSFSGDSEMKMEDLCEKAVALNYTEITFTDHVDWEWPEEFTNISFVIEDFDLYFAEIERLQKIYAGKLSIKKGVEIGLQSHNLDRSTDLINQYPFDFVLGSVHLVNGLDPYSKSYFKNKNKEESYTQYYQQILDIVSHYRDFDVLGHMDYVKRYAPFPRNDDDWMIGNDIVTDIFQTLIANDIGIEVNLSGMREPAPYYTMPHVNIVKQYKDMGGKILTLGTDSHALEHFDLKLRDSQLTLIDLGIDELTCFDRRIPSFYSINR